MKNTTYTYAEPEEGTMQGFFDQNGKFHATRDEAIAANVKDDVLIALRLDLVKTLTDDSDARGFQARSLIRLIEQNPTMFQDLLDNLS